MSGMRGDDEEQPARSSESRMMEMAMRIMRTWWYPRKGMYRVHPTWKRGILGG